jgi:hypothetical protein
MSVNLISEDSLRAVLRPHRVSPESFEAGVRQRLSEAEGQRARNPFAGLSPMWRAAAAMLPLPFITGCQVKGAAAQLAPAAGLNKLFGYLAFPAISLFLLLGASIVSVAKIRGAQHQNGRPQSDGQAMQESVRQWWRDHKWGARLVFAATLALQVLGASWLLFVFYIVSFSLLIYVLSSLARLGLGNRLVVGQSCLMGLMFLGQTALFPQIGANDIHFVDQRFIGAVFMAGTLLLLPFILGVSRRSGFRMEETPRWLYAIVPLQLVFALIAWWMDGGLVIPAIILGSTLVALLLIVWRARFDGQSFDAMPRRAISVLFALITVPFIVWILNPILWPATPARIKSYVESFDQASFSSSSWKRWEIPASWTIQSQLNPDLTKPRRLLAQELAGEQNPFILGTALRLDMIEADQVDELRDYETRLDSLINRSLRARFARINRPFLQPRPIASLDQLSWVIHTAVLKNDLSAEDRDYLEARLLATLDNLGGLEVLEPALRATQLLEVIGRPVDRDRYRESIHGWLVKSLSKSGGGFQLAGGFMKYLNTDRPLPGQLDATADAVELMEIYGIPDGLDLNWVRSFLRPLSFRPMGEQWMVAATLDRLNKLPGATQPTWFEVLYYERALLAAAVLVGLCIYATYLSPPPKRVTNEIEPACLHLFLEES